MVAGRKPKPTAIKRASGNPGRRPLNEREPSVGAASVRAPRGMTPEAKAKWRQLAPMLIACGVLTALDRDVLQVYCETWARWQRAEALVSKGLMGRAGNGAIIVNPAVRVVRDCIDQISRLESELGMTPSSRSRIQTFAPEPEKSIAEMLAEAIVVEDGADATN